MNELDKKYQYGWYGVCGTDCKSFSFKDLGANRKYIDAVVRVAPGDGMSFEKFTAYDPDNTDTCPWVKNLKPNQSFDQFINPQFMHMNCGQAYLVVKNESYDNVDVTIDNFTIADFDGTSGGFVAIDGCPVPTPTPTPMPPDININAVKLRYDIGQDDKAEATIEISLINSITWQWKIDSDPNNWNVVRPNNGQPVREDKIILDPGTYTITAQGLTDDTEDFVNGPKSEHTFTFTIDAPTPTPTPVVTPTPTPTPTETPTETPTPTPTPVNCNCGPDDLERTIIQSSDQTEPTTWTTKRFQGFDLDVEVGMSENEWSGPVPNPTVMQFLEDGESLGLITLSGYHPATGGASIHFKIENKCFVGSIPAGPSTGIQKINVQPVQLHQECAGCCGNLLNSFVLQGTTGSSSDGKISAITQNLSGIMCYGALSDAPEIGTRTFNCYILDDPTNPNDKDVADLLITLTNANLDDTLVRFDTELGCFEGNLVDPTRTEFTKVS